MSDRTVQIIAGVLAGIIIGLAVAAVQREIEIRRNPPPKG